MKKGIQQIMLGTACKDESGTAETLQRIRSAGYDGIELNRFMVNPSSLMVRLLTKAAGMPTGNGGKLDWHTLIRNSGLEVISFHTDLGSLENETDTVIEEIKSYNTETAVITGMYRFDYASESEVKDLAKRLNEAGRILSENGIRLLYHNHNAELLKAKPGVSAYDILIEETNPAFVNFEFDSYWFTDGGADAKGWMEKLGSRMKMWHVTDRGTRLAGKAMTPILKADSMELGTGNMDLDGLRKTAEANGITAVILESHKNWIDKDPLRSMELSAKWLNARY